MRLKLVSRAVQWHLRSYAYLRIHLRVLSQGTLMSIIAVIAIMVNSGMLLPLGKVRRKL
jgi:hypothetical protein